jgi:hypothetical protein
MSRILILGLAFLGVLAAWAAAAPAPGGATKSSAPVAAPTNTEEQRRADEIAGLLTDGKLNEARAAAEALLKSGTKDDVALTKAQKVLAEALRKKGEWRLAASAYGKLRERYEKASDDYIRNDAIADLLRATPNGIYPPTTGTAPAATATASAAGGTPTSTATATSATASTASGTAAADPPPGKTLADDAVLAEALAKVGALKTIKIKQTTAAVKRAGTPQQTLTALAPAAAATHEMFVLGPNLPADAPHEAGAAAAARLEALGKAILGQYESKMDTYRPQFRTPWNMTNTQRDDVNNASKTCKDLMNVETTFQQQLPLLAGSQGWPDQERFITESKERAANYNKLSQQFVVPKYTTIYY